MLLDDGRAQGGQGRHTVVARRRAGHGFHDLFVEESVHLKGALLLSWHNAVFAQISSACSPCGELRSIQQQAMDGSGSADPDPNRGGVVLKLGMAEIMGRFEGRESWVPSRL